MVPRYIHINIPRMAETWVTRFIEKLVCWDQVKSVNGRIGIKQDGNIGELVYGSDEWGFVDLTRKPKLTRSAKRGTSAPEATLLTHLYDLPVVMLALIFSHAALARAAG